MQVIRRAEAPKRTTTSGSVYESRRYYLPRMTPLEIIETVMSRGDQQPLHRHKVIREATLVIEGRISVEEIADGKTGRTELHVGDFVVFDPGSCHKMKNVADGVARTLTFKFIGGRKDGGLFQRDKYDCDSVGTAT